MTISIPVLSTDFIKKKKEKNVFISIWNSVSTIGRAENFIIFFTWWWFRSECYSFRIGRSIFYFYTFFLSKQHLYISILVGIIIDGILTKQSFWMQYKYLREYNEMLNEQVFFIINCCYEWEWFFFCPSFSVCTFPWLILYVPSQMKLNTVQFFSRCLYRLFIKQFLMRLNSKNSRQLKPKKKRRKLSHNLHNYSMMMLIWFQCLFCSLFFFSL